MMINKPNFTYISFPSCLLAIFFVLMVIGQMSCGNYINRNPLVRFHTEVSNSLPIKAIWTYNSNTPIKVPPQANNEIVVVLQTNGVLVALDNKTGEKRWAYDTGTNVGDPWSEAMFDLNDDLLITPKNNSELIILDAQNGQELWGGKLNIVAKTTLNLQIINDIVVVSTFSTKPTTEGYIAGYHLETMELIWEKYYPSRSFEWAFSCPHILNDSDSGSYTVCVSLYNRLETIDFNPLLPANLPRITNNKAWILASYNTPYYQEGYIFSNPSPIPAIEVLETESNNQFALPEQCKEQRIPYPVQVYSELVLASTGCGELYTLNINSLPQPPQWVFQSPHFLRSSFVTLQGDIGYVLNEKAEVLGIDLDTGEVVGQFTTRPTSLEKTMLLNSLEVKPPYLFAFFNGHQLIVFEEK